MFYWVPLLVYALCFVILLIAVLYFSWGAAVIGQIALVGASRPQFALGLSSRCALPVLGDGRARLGLLSILQSFILEVQGEFLLFET